MRVKEGTFFVGNRGTGEAGAMLNASGLLPCSFKRDGIQANIGPEHRQSDPTKRPLLSRKQQVNINNVLESGIVSSRGHLRVHATNRRELALFL